MRILVQASVLAGAMFWSLSAAAGQLGVLKPVSDNGQPLLKESPDHRRVPVVTQVREGELFAQLQREAAQGFTATMLALDQAAQRLGGTSPAPTWLYLSEEEGGFARRGFWLREQSQERYFADPYVDLVVDSASVRDGNFEEIFAHELGHVFLRRLLPNLPEGYSRTPHGSLSVTDYPTAFDEGFAIHIQGLVRRQTRNAALHAQDLGMEYQPLVPYWLSNIDRAARIDGVRRNWFVQKQVTLPGSGDGVARRDLSTFFDNARLKNGNQMLASEGVLATVFFRWLVPGAGEEAAIVDRYSRFFTALMELRARAFEPDAPIVLELLTTYARLHPDEAARVLGLYLDTTYGATADPHMVQITEALAARGRLGDIEGFVSDLKPARAALDKLRATVVQSPATLGAALGPNIWLAGGGQGASTNSAVNLNTAELEHLQLLPGIDAPTAQRALDSRGRQGPFRDLHDFATRAGIGAEGEARLAERATALQKAGTYPRE